MASPSDQDLQPDPVFLHSRREAAIIFAVWILCLIWTVPYCYWNGYVAAGESVEVSTILGVPSWAFWGIAVPWLLADVFTIWFCISYMRDADLGDEGEPDEGDQRLSQRESSQ
jgi:hypothetical protein